MYFWKWYWKDFLLSCSRRRFLLSIFCLIDFLFHINDRIFNRFNRFFAYWNIIRLWCSWYINTYYFNKVLGWFYLSGASGHSDAVNISSSVVELDDSNFCNFPWFSICVVSFSLVLKDISYIAIGPWGSLFPFFGVEKLCYLLSRRNHW